MKVTIAVLADYANVSREGKLNIMGIFNRVTAPQFPTVHPLMHLVLRLSLHNSESGKRLGITIRLVDADGNRLLEISGEGVMMTQEPGEFFADQVLTLANLVFPTPGDYAFDVLVNDEHRTTVPLKVVHALPDTSRGTPALQEGRE